jgi:dTDP-4-dehydrorhamnose reductase
MSAKKVLVIGGNGMLGHKLVQVLPRFGYEVYATVRGKADKLQELVSIPADRIFAGVDVRDIDSVEAVVRDVRPGAVINAAGIVKQKEEGKDAALVIEVNSVFPHRLSTLTEAFSCRLVTISTDCVFSGKKGCYAETDTPDAQDLYGRSKCLGEVTTGNAVTLRTSMIGREIGTPHGLLEWFLANSGAEVRGFTEAYFSGFPTVSLSRIIGDIVLKDERLKGVMHVSADRISKFDLLNLINVKYALETRIDPDDGLVIDRSLDSRRFRAETGFEPPEWGTLIEEMRDDPTPYPIWKN